MAEQAVKVIPSKGSRITGARWLAGFSVLAWIACVLMVKLDWFTTDEAELMLWTPVYMKWGLTTAFAVYAASETGVKIGEAYMNRNS